jgi:hypothetical protein
MTLQEIFGRPYVRAAVAHRRARRPLVERLELRAVPASYTAATVDNLRDFINAANATPEADTITLAADTTFTLTVVNNTADGATGLPVIAAGEDLTIVGNGATIERNTAADTPAFRLLDMALGASLRLENLTLQGGRAEELWWDQAPGGRGGAIYNQGNLTLDGVTVQNNIAHGHDRFAAGGSALGGGIYSGGSLVVTGSTIRDNAAIGGIGADGVNNWGWLQPGFAGGNGYGGGLYIAGGTASISNSTVTANIAQGGAGGAGISGTKTKLHKGEGSGQSGSGSDGFATAGGDGGSGRGGGLYAAAGTTTLLNTEVTTNTAQGGAGGSGGGQQPDGKPGDGSGGGLYIDASAAVFLDDYTVDHIRRNKASTSDRHIHGAYALPA